LIDFSSGSLSDQSGTLDKPEDAGRGGEGVVARWLMEIDAARKHEKDWRERARAAIERYRQDDGDGKQRFNILWSNTEVMRPALYNSTPQPDVRRRFRDADPDGKQAAQVMERALVSSLERSDFDQTMALAVLDLLLPGRAVVRERYEPEVVTIRPEPRMPDPVGVDPFGQPVHDDADTDDQGMPVEYTPEPYDEIQTQKTRSELVDWDDFAHGPGGRWDQVEWIAFRHRLTREQLQEHFGRRASKIELDYSEAPNDNQNEAPDVFRRAIIWEIWHKPSKKVIWIAPSSKEGPVRTDDDPLELMGFFPTPRPMYALESSDTLVPVELFRLYKDQADELDRITQRINRLIEQVKVRGVYDATMKVLDRLSYADDGDMLQADDGALALMQAGGSFENAIWMMPIEPIARVLGVLYQQRQAIVQTIYEITGLSDILRGQTNPNETASAQQLKAQTGSRRLQRMQREVQRYARDLMRIKAEIISEQFEPEFISEMAQMEATPEVMAILRNDLSRLFRIDIETDSTIAADEAEDKQQFMELLSGVGQYLNTVAPLVQTGAIPQEAATTLLASVLRHFRLGRKVEDALEMAEEAAPQGQQEGGGQPSDPAAEQQAQAMQAEMQMKQAEMQAEQQRKDAESQAEIARRDREVESEIQRKQMEMQARLEIEREKVRGQMQVQAMKARQTNASNDAA